MHKHGELFKRFLQKFFTFVDNDEIVHISGINFNAQLLLDKAVYLVKIKKSENLTCLVADGNASARFVRLGTDRADAVTVKVGNVGMVAVYNHGQQRFYAGIADLGAKNFFKPRVRYCGKIF